MRARRTALLCVATLLALAVPGATDEVGDASRLLRDGRRPVEERVAAAHALGTAAEVPGRGRERALPLLLAALEDPEADLRAAVAGSLARADDVRALGALQARASREPDETVLAALLLAVGAVGGPAEAAWLEPWCDHASARLRAAAATALGDVGGERARTRLLGLLARPGPDPDWGVRGAVVLGLSRCGRPEDAGLVLVAYREGDGASWWFARAALAQAVGALDTDPVSTLDRLVADPDPRVSSVAALAFVRAGRPDEVLARLGDPRPGVRAAAACAVASAELRRALPRLRDLATGDPDRAVRWSAVLALSRLDDPTGDAFLLEGLASDDPSVWASAVAECRRKTGLSLGREVAPWREALASRRREGAR